MGGFISSLFGGQNKSLNQDMGLTKANAGFSTNLGEHDLSDASNFMSGIVSGDQKQIGQVLAPQISGIQDRQQQQENTTAEFGNRSGGNNSAMQVVHDQAHAHINDLIGELTGTAVSGEASVGASQLAAGEADTKDNAEMSQQQMENYMHSIIGQGLTEGVGAVEGFGLGKM